MSEAREVRAPRGTDLNAKSWQTEAPLRMLMNNLDPEVAERPEDLVVYGGTGRAARSWEAFDAIVETLKDLESDETLLVQSGKPVGVWKTNEWAPRVLIANSNLVGDWANWEHFRKLEDEGLMMYGQMTAGSWIYIATQGILQGTFETFAAVAKKRFDDTLAGTLTLTAGCGGMGGAQPLAVTLNKGVCLIIDVDEKRLKRRQGKRYLDEVTDNLDDAIKQVNEAKEAKKPLSVGLVGNAAELYPEILRRHKDGELTVDIVTDQTSAHDPLSYLPTEITVEDWQSEAKSDPETFTKKAREAMAAQVQAMVEFQDEGAEVFDYGNSIRDEARKAGYSRAFEFPGFVPAYIRPLFCEGLGPFRWAALSGDPEDIKVTDEAIKELFPDNEHLHTWIDAAQEFVEYEGLPARICWLGYNERHKAGLKFNELVREGKLKAPVVIGRDHRVHAGRHRRRGRLAAAQRYDRRVLRRDLGVHPPRRRCGHGPLHPRRPGHRGRRQRACRCQAARRPHQRPGHGRYPPRRRRLLPRRRGGKGARRAHPDGVQGPRLAPSSPAHAHRVL